MKRKTWILPLALIMILATVSSALAAWDSPDRHYTFDDVDTFATYTKDSSTNDINGVFYNLTSYGIENATQQSYAGFVGEAYLFYEKPAGAGSVDDFAIDTQFTATGPFTMATWFKTFYADGVKDSQAWFESSNQDLFYIQNSGGATPGLYEMFMCEDAVCNEYLYWYDLNLTTYIPAQEWVHLVIQYTGENNNCTDMKIYVNGTLLPEDFVCDDSVGAFTGIDWGSETMGINSLGFYGGAAAYMDDFKLYDEALTQGDITNLYNSYFCTPSWVCNGYGACNPDTQSQSCNSVLDLNLCGEAYTGNYTEFPEQDCYTPGGYEAQDLPSIIIDGLGKLGVFFISMVSLFAFIYLWVWARKRLKDKKQ